MVTRFDIDIVSRHLEEVRTSFSCAGHLSILHLFLREEFNLTDEEINDALCDGGNDRGIDAIYIDSQSENVIINIFQSKQHKSGIGVKNFPSNEIDKVLSFLSDFLGQTEGFYETLNEPLADLTQRMHDIFSHRRPQVRLFFISNGVGLTTDSAIRIQNSLKKYNYINFSEITFEDILEVVLAPENAKRSRSIRAFGDQIFDRSDGNVRGIITTVRASELINLITTDDGRYRIDRSIFNENIRVFLGLKNPVNRKILGSALSQDRHIFWYLNNGVTIVCESASFPEGFDSPVIEMTAPQIINGAQTCHALHEAQSKGEEEVRDVSVLVRIYETKRSDISQKVAISTNSQTRIFNRDLMSNDDVQVKVQHAMRQRGIYYARKRREHLDVPESTRIDALKFGQIRLAYSLRMPERARRDSDQIFGSYYDDIFRDDLEIDEMVSAWHCLREIESRPEYALARRKRASGDRGLRALTYANFHILFLVSVLAEHQKVSIADRSARETLIASSLNLVTELVKEDTRGLYEVFRDAKTKERLIQLAEGSKELPPHFQLTLPL